MKQWISVEWRNRGKYIIGALVMATVITRIALIEKPYDLMNIGAALGSVCVLLAGLWLIFFSENMQSLLGFTRDKEYALWLDWHVTLSGKYEHVDNDDSGQLVNYDGSRVIYGSSFMLQSLDSVNDEIQYLGFKKDEEGSFHLSASVSQHNEFLAITITFTDPLDEEWARKAIESAQRVAV